MPGNFAIHLLCVIFCVEICAFSGNTVAINEDKCNLTDSLKKEIQSYQSTVNSIVEALTNGKFKGKVYDHLTVFVDKFGSRMTGSKNLENSIDYLLELMKNNDIEDVHGEEVEVPHWVRELEHGEMLEPRKAKLPVIALGSSISTPEEGITAEVVVVKSFEELSQRNVSDAAKGKIVVYNQEFTNYDDVMVYRSRGATEASKHGAVAALVRSLTPFSMSTLYTGQQTYRDNVTAIPAACITVEDARMMQRMQDRSETIKLRIKIKTQNLNETTSRNSVGEITGSEQPEKVVLVSGHIDSWDAGVGAMDDGGGTFISWYSLAVLKALGLRAKRTIRTVIWTAEEQCYCGVNKYNITHQDELDNFIFVMESDEGTWTPLGLTYNANAEGGCILKEILKLLAPINATQAVQSATVGSDISLWTQSRIPGASLLNENGRWFWFQHTDADTMDVMDPDGMDKSTAVWASVAYVLADLSQEFPRELPTFNYEKSAFNSAIKRSFKSDL